MRCHTSQPDVFALASWRLLPHEQEVQWESDVERIRVVDLLDIFAGQLERQSGDVAIQVRLLAASHDREDVGSLVEDISKSKSGQDNEHSPVRFQADLRNRGDQSVLLLGN